MTDQHPITPPPELVQQWRKQAPRYCDGRAVAMSGTDGTVRGMEDVRELWLINRAAEWGYEQRGEVNEAKLQQARDEELEALCEWLNNLPSPDLLIRSSLRSHHGEEGTQTPPPHRRTTDD